MGIPPSWTIVVFLSLSEESGLANVVLHPVVYERDHAVVRAGSILWVEGVASGRCCAFHYH
jgi:hypothetical protein